jgi:hypothetical protein
MCHPLNLIRSVVTDVARGAGEYCPAPVTRDQTVLCRWDRQGDRKCKSSAWVRTNCYAALQNLHDCKVIFGGMLHHLLLLPLGQ